MRRAFTLIEAMVVVAVISLLVALALPGMAKARSVSRRIACQANLRQLHSATQAVWLAEGQRALPEPPSETSPSGRWIDPVPTCPGDRREPFYYVFVCWTFLTEHQLEHPDDVYLTLADGSRVPFDFNLWSCGWNHAQAVTWSGVLR